MPRPSSTPRRPPAYGRLRRRAVAVLVASFFLALAAVIWHSVGGTVVAVVIIVLFMTATRCVPLAINTIEGRIRDDVWSQIQQGDLPCSVCETRIRIGRDTACPGCGCTLSLTAHRARWGV